MKRHLIAASIMAMAAFALAGCSSGKDSTPASTESSAADTQADASDTAATEVDTAATEASASETTGKTISPLPSSVNLENLIQNMDDATVAVSIEEGGIYKNDASAIMMDVTLYDYDMYDMVDISQMAVGDTITICGEDVVITELEQTDSNYVINGGIENGGYELMTEENTTYRATTWDDLKLYYEVGQGSFPVSSDFSMEDSSDLEAGTVTYTIDDILNGDVAYWYVPNNTTVRISGGQIVSLTRIYNP